MHGVYPLRAPRLRRLAQLHPFRADWSTLYLRDQSHATAAIAAGGYGAFMLAAMLTRFRADLLTARTGVVVVARLGAVLGAGGLVLRSRFPELAGAATGIAFVGVGTAVILPLTFAAGANLGASATPLAVVMSAGYLGSVVGPALIGNTADRFGLRVAMLIPLAAAVVIALLAGNLAPVFHSRPHSGNTTASPANTGGR